MTRMPRTASAALAAALALVLAGGALAHEPMPIDHTVVGNEGFLRHHPDLRHQRAGQAALDNDEPSRAYGHFRDAARYGNKLAQAMVAEMLWDGRGTDRDRALAYAWMDLAAERGHSLLAALRERYWSELTPDERERALAVGEDVYAEFGDAVAKPRLEREIRRGAREATGSRVGAGAGFVDVYTDLDQVHLSNTGIRGQRAVDYYHERYWSPEAYWEWQDAILDRLPRGTVRIDELQQADGAFRSQPL